MRAAAASRKRHRVAGGGVILRRGIGGRRIARLRHPAAARDLWHPGRRNACGINEV